MTSLWCANLNRLTAVVARLIGAEINGTVDGEFVMYERVSVRSANDLVQKEGCHDSAHGFTLRRP
jgi:hypothetical protein